MTTQINLDTVEPVGFRLQECAALFHSSADQRVFILGVGNRGPVALEENLIETALVIERAEGRFEALHRIIPAGVVQALVIDAADAQRSSEVA